MRAAVWVDPLTSMPVHDLRPTATPPTSSTAEGLVYRPQLKFTSSDALIAVHVFG